MNTFICPMCGVEFKASGNRRYCHRACSNKAPNRFTEEGRKRLVESKCGDKNPSRRPEVAAKISEGHRQSGKFAGPNNANFKGGWIAKGSKGGQYVLVWLPPEERHKYPIVRAAYTRRSYKVWNDMHPDDPVCKGNVIHHQNGNSLDDTPGNLEKLPSQREHARTHFKRLRKPLSETHKRQLSQAKQKLPDRYCEHCGAVIPRKNLTSQSRFCSPTCHYDFRRGKGRSGW